MSLVRVRGYWHGVRGFFTRLAVYCGLTTSYAPHPERPTRFAVFVIVFAALIVAVVFDATRALVGGSPFELADTLWHGAVFGTVGVIVRFVEYLIHVRSERNSRGTASFRRRWQSGAVEYAADAIETAAGEVGWCDQQLEAPTVRDFPVPEREQMTPRVLQAFGTG